MEIKPIRQALGLTQEQMAERLGLHQSTFCRYECGKLPMTKRMELAIAALQHEAERAA